MIVLDNHALILKMLNLFGEMIRAGKNHRQEAVQTNIFTAVLCALKRLSEHKGSLNQEDVKKAAADLVLVSYYYYYCSSKFNCILDLNNNKRLYFGYVNCILQEKKKVDILLIFFEVRN